MTRELEGKIAFVTGSGRGLGSVMARRLAEQGAHVAVHDLTWESPARFGEFADLGEVRQHIEALGVKSVAVTGNIGDREAVGRMKAEIESMRSRASSAPSSSSSIAPAVTSVPRATSPSPTTCWASPTRTS